MIMKSISERASPCLKPLACQIFGPEEPFKRMLVEVDARKIDIQFLHLNPKPFL
jgi:hypothetical protein